MSARKYFLSFLLCGLSVWKSQAQTEDNPNVIAIPYNLETGVVTGDVPFEQAFTLNGTLPANDKATDHMTVEFALTRTKQVNGTMTTWVPDYDTNMGTWNRRKDESSAYVNDMSFTLPVPCISGSPVNYHFRAGRTYYLRVISYDKNGKILIKREFSFIPKTSFSNFVKLDFGVGQVPLTKAVVGETATHIYFTFVNDNTDLFMVNGAARNFFMRTSVYIGLSVATIASSTQVPVTNQYSTGNLIVGVGIRSPFYGCWWPSASRTAFKVLQPLRINVGEIFFKQTNANTLLTTPVQKHALYGGFSYEFTLAGFFGSVGKIFN